MMIRRMVVAPGRRRSSAGELRNFRARRSSLRGLDGSRKKDGSHKLRMRGFNHNGPNNPPRESATGGVLKLLLAAGGEWLVAGQ